MSPLEKHKVKVHSKEKELQTAKFIKMKSFSFLSPYTIYECAKILEKEINRRETIRWLRRNLFSFYDLEIIPETDLRYFFSLN